MHWQMKKITRGMVNGVWIAGFLNSGCFFFFFFFSVLLLCFVLGGFCWRMANEGDLSRGHPEKTSAQKMP